MRVLTGVAVALASSPTAAASSACRVLRAHGVRLAVPTGLERVLSAGAGPPSIPRRSWSSGLQVFIRALLSVRLRLTRSSGRSCRRHRRLEDRDLRQRRSQARPRAARVAAVSAPPELRVLQPARSRKSRSTARRTGRRPGQHTSRRAGTRCWAVVQPRALTRLTKALDQPNELVGAVT
jgi:hypothetical protein